MSGTTTAMALRYPDLTDPPNGAGQIKNLADDVDGYMPRGEVSYVEVTADQGSLTTEANITSLTLTFTPVGSRVFYIEAICKFLSTAASDAGQLAICTSADAHLAECDFYLPVTTSRMVTARALARVTPTDNVSVTYKVRASRVAGTGTFTMKAAATYPASLRIIDVGPV